MLLRSSRDVGPATLGENFHVGGGDRVRRKEWQCDGKDLII